ncbi:Glycosyl transferases group 1 family protein [Kiritimatiella glycovorans]|uniref:Glycosyl transferases group 1 family protein n=2 Tax=Kiritimatiella glycovorans TaxID=1307763 RepID=A0A0G3EL82_9BACT|nr:Glycosyl transferases group 1 family protein [Kiritimatiella glycovorans]
MIAPYPAAAVLPPEYIRPVRRDEHPSSWVRALSMELGAQRDFEVRIFSLSRAVRRHHIAELGLLKIEFVPQRIPARFDWYQLQLLNALKLYPHLRRFSPDVVHAFGIETGNGVMLSWLPFRRSCFLQGIVEKLHPFVDKPEIMQQIRMRLEGRTVRRMDGLIAETPFAKQWAESRGAKHVVLIPHAVNREFLDAEPAPGGNHDLVAVGTLLYHKGFDTVLRAFSRLPVPDARLRIIGEGPARGELERLARELQIADRVEFPGTLRREEVVRVMQQSSLLCIGSRMDTSPNVVTEAHAVGLPVVGTDAGGIPDMIEDGVDGYVVPMDDDEAMAEKMGALLKEPAGARSMGESGRTKVARLNDGGHVAKRHIEYFRNLVAAGAGSGA